MEIGDDERQEHDDAYRREHHRLAFSSAPRVFGQWQKGSKSPEFVEKRKERKERTHIHDTHEHTPCVHMHPLVPAATFPTRRGMFPRLFHLTAWSRRDRSRLCDYDYLPRTVSRTIENARRRDRVSKRRLSGWRVRPCARDPSRKSNATPPSVRRSRPRPTVANAAEQLALATCSAAGAASGHGPIFAGALRRCTPLPTTTTMMNGPVPRDPYIGSRDAHTMFHNLCTTRYEDLVGIVDTPVSRAPTILYTFDN